MVEGSDVMVEVFYEVDEALESLEMSCEVVGSM